MTKSNQYFPETVPHPGATLKEKLGELEIGPKEFAIKTGKPEQTISKILNNQSSITGEMAVKFEKVLKIPAHFWLNNQSRYDEYISRLKFEKEIQCAEEWARKFPIREMVDHGWIQADRTIKSRVIALFSFFSIANKKAWERYYLKQDLKVSFRISLSHANNPYALSAWLRKGEILASDIDAPEFDKNALKSKLSQLKDLMAEQPDDFFDKIKKYCLEAGLKVIYTPKLPKAPISGSTRWLLNNPVIQLTNRYKRNDIFWFTFFHELGHVLLHGKKDIFLENIDYSGKDLDKEKEADNFAIRWTFTKEEENELLKKTHINENEIYHFAKECNTHPAMIIGRLQKRGIISYQMGQNFIQKIEISNN